MSTTRRCAQGSGTEGRLVKPFRLLVVPVLLLVLALAWGRYAHATSRMYVPWVHDMSRAQDSVPPSRPRVKLVAILRAGGSRLRYEMTPRYGGPDTLELLETQSSSADDGELLMKVRGRDDRTRPDGLGWRARVVVGRLRDAFWATPVVTSEYARGVTAPDTGWYTLWFTFKDWSWEMGDDRDSL